MITSHLPSGVALREQDNAADRGCVVLIGASNVCYAFPRLAQGLLVGLGCDVFAAHGHGRSLGMKSTVLSRDLPGILECGIWPALAEYVADRPHSTAPRVALVTDVGNDLLYQVPLPNIVGWLEECLHRLHELGFESVVTSIPMQSVLAMGPLRFMMYRNLLFPECRMTLNHVREGAAELDAAIRNVAEARGLQVVEPRGKWYSADPIHIRQSRQRRAFQAMCAQWRTMPPVLFGRFPWDRAHYWWNKQPHLRWVRRQKLIQPQPVWRGPHGNVLRMY